MSDMDDCKKYDNLMSLKLDGLLDAEKERVFNNHIAYCPQCAPMWEAMVETDKMLWGWMSEPHPVPANFHIKVMTRVATSPITHMQVAPVYAGIAVPQPTRPLPILPNTGPLTGGLTGPLTMRLTELQGRIAPYVRWIAAGVLAVASMAGLVMALVVSGVLTFEGEMAGVAGAFRTFFQAADTWVRSLFVGIGPGMFVVAGIILGLLVLAGWQVASAYQRSVMEQRRGTTGYLEALS
jgi:anti-sigma factor RsiW